MSTNANDLKWNVECLLYAMKTKTYFFASTKLSRDRTIAMWTGDAGILNFPISERDEGVIALLLPGQTVKTPEQSWRVFQHYTAEEILKRIDSVHQSSIVANKDLETLHQYCLDHPQERLWQALANITGKHIWLTDKKPDGQIELLDDTYYFDRLEQYEPRT